MIEELKITILNRVIKEFFQEADKLIKEGLKVTNKNKKMVALGLSISLMGMTHAYVPPALAVTLDFFNVFIVGGALAQINVDKIKLEAEKVKDFFIHFNLEEDELAHKVLIEFTSDERNGTYFTKEQIDKMVDNGILNLQKEEIELFSHIRFNDNQEEYLKTLIAKNEKINLINFLDLSLLEPSYQNKKFVNLGGKNKTLKDIMEPAKKMYLMK